MVNRFNRNGRHFWVGKIITQNYSSKDKQYLRANLRVGDSQNCILTHRLVAEAFVGGKTTERDEVNHKDGDKTNNRSDNLEWVTTQENKDHAINTGLQWYPDGEQCSFSKLTEQDVIKILHQYFFEFKLQKDIAKEFGMTGEYISLITRGLRWKKVFGKFVSENEGHYNSVKDKLKRRNGGTVRKTQTEGELLVQ